MKGLIRNNFYSMESNLKISFIMAAAFVFSPLIINNANTYPMIIAIQVFLFIANTGTSLHADEVAKWNKFELTLPVKRSAIIGAKYITFAILILCGLLIGFCTVICISLSGQAWNLLSILWGYEYGLVLSIISISLMYPVMLKIGTEKNELVLILSAFAAIGLMFLIAAVLSPITDGMNLHHPLVGGTSTSVALVMFLISFMASVNIHKNKEF
ncbi:MAG: ABC-2 transporter permease [Lachnospiraceae bacterium]|nr:ABC-2 transporter permease [Lachnospiraceae bacterium]